ncbi:hypothetical protein BDN70DRAFT_546460 [Pholiota conissans]|uniref:Uncharacterized protein n=1 Tax=Pholiota conissans TaxID=109636 RepID=A0A9P5YPS7_9AGAR|nr:hypothetical protein BDN70DRAFT_546460 [Pholiota conissans]
MNSFFERSDVVWSDQDGRVHNFYVDFYTIVSLAERRCKRYHIICCGEHIYLSSPKTLGRRMIISLLFEQWNEIALCGPLEPIDNWTIFHDRDFLGEYKCRISQARCFQLSTFNPEFPLLHPFLDIVIYIHIPILSFALTVVIAISPDTTTKP